jgi:4-oxalocrotonate tautomerase
MPLITVKLIEDVFTPEQKVKIIETLTDAMVAIEGENLRDLTFVLIEEVKQGNWGVGGKPLTASDVRRLQGAVAA